MSPRESARKSRILDQADGFLRLRLPQRALALLRSEPAWPLHNFRARYLTGKALRQLGDCAAAVHHLEPAAALRPGHPGVALDLAWCYKRTHRLAQAIGLLERTVSRHRNRAVLYYNLACYWSRAGNARMARRRLLEAIALNEAYFTRFLTEPDFDPVRGDALFGEFQRQEVELQER